MAGKTQTLLSALDITSGTTAVSSTISLDNPVNVVDVFSAGAYGSDTLTAEFSVDGGTVWYTVPFTSRTAGTGHIMSFVCYGQKLRFKLTGATAGTSAIVLNVITEAVSMSVQKLVEIGTSAANYSVNFGSAPEQVCVVAQAGTWDTLDVYVDGSPDGGTTWYQMGTYGVMEEDEFFIFDNPAKLTNFRVRTANQDAGTVSAVCYVIGAENAGQLKQVQHNPQGAARTFDAAVAWDGAAVFPALTDETEIQADLDKVWEALETAGLLPSRSGGVNI